MGRETGERLLHGYRVPIWGDEKFLEIDGGNSCTVLAVIVAQYCECKSSHGTV